MRTQDILHELHQIPNEIYRELIQEMGQRNGYKILEQTEWELKFSWHSFSHIIAFNVHKYSVIFSTYRIKRDILDIRKVSYNAVEDLEFSVNYRRELLFKIYSGKSREFGPIENNSTRYCNILERDVNASISEDRQYLH